MSLQIPQQPVFLADMIGTVVTAVDAALYNAGPTNAFPHVYYMHGHPQEIVNRLQQKLALETEREKRFPLVMLFHDFEIVRRSGQYFGTATVNMAIAQMTNKDYNTPERYTNTFKPILYPIYYELLKQLGLSANFVNAQAILEHTLIDRVYWGRTGLYGNTANQFDDYLDCIEVRGLGLTIKNPHCKPFKS